MTWTLTSLLSGETVFVGGTIGLYRILLSLAMFWKFGVEFVRGHHTYLDHGQYPDAKYQTFHGDPWVVTSRNWRVLSFLRIGAAVALLLGVATKLALAIIVLSLVIELRFYFKYFANFLLLQCIGLLFSKSVGVSCSVPTLVASSSWSDFLARSYAAEEWLFVPLYLQLTLAALYGVAGIRKLSRPFLSGALVSTSLYVLALERGRRLHWDTWTPEFLVKRVMNPDGSPTRLLSVFMWATMIAELLLPVGIFVQDAWWVVAVVGIAMHAGFTMLLPSTLLDFSLAAVSTYVVLAPIRVPV